MNLPENFHRGQMLLHAELTVDGGSCLAGFEAGADRLTAIVAFTGTYSSLGKQNVDQPLITIPAVDVLGNTDGTGVREQGICIHTLLY